MVNPDSDTWHTRLAAARRAKGYTRKALAPLVGVTAPAVTNWENGKTKKLDGEYLKNVCRVLEITPEWLLGDVDESPAALPKALTNEPMPIGDATADLKAYGECLEILELALNKLGRTLAPDKKRAAVEAMYRAWARDKRIDQQLLDMITQLAA